MSLGRTHPKPFSGDEPFHHGLDPTATSVRDFWRWSCSGLLSNTTRGVLAEFIVARALGAESDVRSEWDPYDLRLPDGTTVEVKSAAYIQSWHQEKPSRISFGIAPTLAWNPETNTWGNAARRQADVYVFCLLGWEDQVEVDPLDLDQWRFFVVPTRVLDEKVGEAKTIGLAGLMRSGPLDATYEDLHHAVTSLNRS